MRNLGLALLAAFVAAGTCDACPPPQPSSSSCDPCDPVLLLHSDGEPGLVPDTSLVQACSGREPPTGQIAAAWKDQTCWRQVARYSAETVWHGPGGPDANWEEFAHGTNLCPSTGTAGSGCAGQSGDEGGEPPPSITGLLELDPYTDDPAVAFLVRSPGGMPTPNPTASFDLNGLISAALAGDCPEQGVGTQRFEDGAPCTAFLIGEGLVMTALHCYDKPADFECSDPFCLLPAACDGQAPNELGDQVLAFDYTDYGSPWKIGTNLRVEACGGGHDVSKDWMVLSFDPPADFGTRCPLALPDAPVDLCAAVNVVGHPLGHPQHRSGSTDPTRPTAWVNKLHNDGSFEATLDNIHSYSGSPVFSATENSLVGLLSEGQFLGGPQLLCGVIECAPNGCTDPGHSSKALDLSTVDLPDHVQLTAPNGC